MRALGKVTAQRIHAKRRALERYGVLTYDEAADTYRLGASVEGERAA